MENPTLTPIHTQTETDWLRDQMQKYRDAALIGFGALQARNIDGQYNLVLETMAKNLDMPAPR